MYFRIFLQDLIINILKVIPEENTELINALNETYKTMFYRAPEILGITYKDILRILSTKVPLHDDDTKNPDWINELKHVWEKGVHTMNNDEEIGMLSKEIQAPPSSEGAK
jgi:hypothetical protein